MGGTLFLFAAMNEPKVSDILGIVNKMAPLHLAEDWDNVGLMMGDPAVHVTRMMIALDAIPEAIEAAISRKCQLLVTHHPFIFHPLKRISASDPTGKLVLRAAAHGLAVISLHTNFDVADGGVSDILAERLGVGECRPLRVTSADELIKLVVFVPKGYEEKVMEALFRFSGVIGAYSECSFRCSGTGTFRPLPGATPFIGKVGERESVDESRVEVLVRKVDLSAAVTAMVKAHPYEEPAFDLFPLLNRGMERGLGRIGVLPRETNLGTFADLVREKLGLPGVRIVGDLARTVKRVALCGGSGMSLLRDAQRQGADVFVTGDVKYHEAREAEALGMAIVDGGHFGTEVLMVESLAARMREELRSRRFDAEVIPFGEERDPFNWR